MGMVKDMLFKQQELHGKTNDDLYLAWVSEIEQIQNDHTLADYVILENGERCFLGNACDPENNKCECK